MRRCGHQEEAIPHLETLRAAGLEIPERWLEPDEGTSDQSEEEALLDSVRSQGRYREQVRAGFEKTTRLW